MTSSTTPLRCPPDLLDPARGTAAVGLRDDDSPATWRLWEPGVGAVPGLIAHRPGGGGSNFLRLLARCGGDLVHVWAMDILGGYNQIADRGAPGVRRVCTDEDTVLHALRFLNDEADLRLRLAADAEMAWSGPTAGMPLLLVLVDDLARTCRNLQAAALVNRLYQQGPAAGIALIGTAHRHDRSTGLVPPPDYETAAFLTRNPPGRGELNGQPFQAYLAEI